MKYENGCYIEGDSILGEDKNGIYPQEQHGSFTNSNTSGTTNGRGPRH